MHGSLVLYQYLALDTRQDAVPRHGRRQVVVDGAGAGRARSQLQAVATHVPVAHVVEESLRAAQRALDAVFVEARVLFDVPELGPPRLIDQVRSVLFNCSERVSSLENVKLFKNWRV